MGTPSSPWTMSPPKVAQLIVMPFGMLTWVGPRKHVLDVGPDPHTCRGNFDDEKGRAEDMPGHAWWSIYSKQLSRGQNWHGADADLGVLDWMLIGATW